MHPIPTAASRVRARRDQRARRHVVARRDRRAFPVRGDHRVSAFAERRRIPGYMKATAERVALSTLIVIAYRRARARAVEAELVLALVFLAFILAAALRPGIRSARPSRSAARPGPRDPLPPRLQDSSRSPSGSSCRGLSTRCRTLARWKHPGPDPPGGGQLEGHQARSPHRDRQAVARGAEGKRVVAPRRRGHAQGVRGRARALLRPCERGVLDLRTGPRAV